MESTVMLGQAEACPTWGMLQLATASEARLRALLAGRHRGLRGRRFRLRRYELLERTIRELLIDRRQVRFQQHVELVLLLGKLSIQQLVDFIRRSGRLAIDRKSTRLNSSHLGISYA